MINVQSKVSTKRSTHTPRLGPKPVFSKPPPVYTVGAHAFALLCNQPGVKLFTLSFSDLGVQLSNTGVGRQDPTRGPDLSLIPEEYHDLLDIFTEREAEKLPPHRPYDHTIPLELGTTPPFGTIYSASGKELEVVMSATGITSERLRSTSRSARRLTRSAHHLTDPHVISQDPCTVSPIRTPSH